MPTYYTYVPCDTRKEQERLNIIIIVESLLSSLKFKHNNLIAYFVYLLHNAGCDTYTTIENTN